MAYKPKLSAAQIEALMAANSQSVADEWRKAAEEQKKQEEEENKPSLLSRIVQGLSAKGESEADWKYEPPPIAPAPTVQGTHALDDTGVTLPQGFVAQPQYTQGTHVADRTPVSLPANAPEPLSIPIPGIGDVAPKYSEGNEYDPVAYWKRIGGNVIPSLEVGSAKALSMIGGGLKELGAEETGSRWRTKGKEWEAEAAKTAPETKEWEGWKSMVDPEFLSTTLMQQAPTSAAIMVPSIAVGAGAGAIAGSVVPGAGNVLGAFGGAAGAANLAASTVFSTAMESAMEAGEVREQALEMGMTEQQAEEAASKVFWENVGVLGATNLPEYAFMLLPVNPKLKKAILATRPMGKMGTAAETAIRVAGSTASEIPQEVAQEYISRGALGQEGPSGKELQEIIGTTALMTGGMSALPSYGTAKKNTAEALENKQLTTISPEVKALLEKFKLEQTNAAEAPPQQAPPVQQQEASPQTTTPVQQQEASPQQDAIPMQEAPPQQAEVIEQEQPTVKIEEQKQAPIQTVTTPKSKASKVFMPSGEAIETEFKVVDVGDLITSHTDEMEVNSNYPSSLQPRERERVASKEQVSSIARKLNPERLGDSSEVGFGSPIISPETTTVESGNGRAIALRLAYKEHPEKAGEYRNWLLENAEKFGLERSEVEGIEQPVLVRVRKTDVSDQAKFARESNIPTMAAMSATETAMADSAAMPNDLVSMFAPDESGNIAAASNRDFLRRFLGEIVSLAERGKYMTSDGKVSQDLVNRVRNAVFAKGFGDSASIERLAESTDNNIRNISQALVAVSPTVATANVKIKEGSLHPLGINQEIVEAANKLTHLRDINMSVGDFLAQQSMFGEEMSDISKDVLKILDEHKRSSKKISSIFSEYYSILESLGDPRQESLFGSTTPTKAEMLEAAIRMSGGDEVGELNLFSDQGGSSTEANSPVAIQEATAQQSQPSIPVAKEESVANSEIPQAERGTDKQNGSSGNVGKTTGEAAVPEPKGKPKKGAAKIRDYFAVKEINGVPKKIFFSTPEEQELYFDGDEISGLLEEENPSEDILNEVARIKGKYSNVDPVDFYNQANSAAEKHYKDKPKARIFYVPPVNVEKSQDSGKAKTTEPKSVTKSDEAPVPETVKKEEPVTEQIKENVEQEESPAVEENKEKNGKQEKEKETAEQPEPREKPEEQKEEVEHAKKLEFPYEKGQTVDSGKKVLSFGITSYESEYTSDEVKAGILMDIEGGELTTNPTKRSETIETGKKIADKIEESMKGKEATLFTLWDAITKESTGTEAERNAAAIELAVRFGKSGDPTLVKIANDLIAFIAHSSAEKGRAIDVLNVMKKWSSHRKILEAKTMVDKAYNGSNKKAREKATETTGKVIEKLKEIQQKITAAVANEIGESSKETEAQVEKSKQMKAAIKELIDDGTIDNLENIVAQSNKYESFKGSVIALINKMVNNGELSIEGLSEQGLNDVIASTLDDMAYDAKEKLGEKLAKKIEKMAVAEDNKKMTPAKKLLTALAKLAQEKIPENDRVKELDSPIEILESALRNKKAYRDVWENSKEALKSIAPQEVIDSIEEFMNYDIGLSIPSSYINKAIRQAEKSFGVKISDVVKQHLSKKAEEATYRGLVEQMMEDSKLPEHEARKIANIVYQRISELSAESKRNALKSMFRIRSKKTQKLLVDRLIELSNLGAFNQDLYLPYIAKYVGLPSLTLTDAENIKYLANEIENAETVGEAEILKARLNLYILKLRPASRGTKIATIQTIAQLWNLKTQARNILGNELFWWIERLSKLMQTMIDVPYSGITGKDRVISFRSGGAQAEYFKALRAGWRMGMEGMEARGTGTQYDLSRAPVFDRDGSLGERVASFFERTLSATLHGFDNAAYTRAYNKTIGEAAYVRAINEKRAGKIKEINKELLDKYMKEADELTINAANEYAMYCTFQDQNIISEGLKGIKFYSNAILGYDKVDNDTDFGKGKIAKRLRISKKAFGFGDLFLKYPQVSGALLMRSIEYSPLGFAISIRDISMGGNNRKAVLESLSRAVVGSVGFTMFGLFLAANGIITGKPPDDKDEYAMQIEQGAGPYRVNLSALYRVIGGGNPKPKAGDIYVSYDWAQPLAASLAMGANIQQKIEAGTWKQDWKKTPFSMISIMGDTIDSGLSTITEQPVLSGIRRIFQGYDSQDSVISRVFDIFLEMPASFVPTLLSQLRQITDNERRVISDPNVFIESKNRVINKLPILSRQLPKDYSTLGEAKTYRNTNAVFRTLDAALNPAITSTYKPSKLAQRIVDIGEEVGTTKHYPRVPAKNIKVSGVTIELPNDYYAYFKEMQGKYSREALEDVSTSLTPEEQAKEMENNLSGATAAAREEVLKKMGIPVVKSSGGIALKNPKATIPVPPPLKRK